MTVTKPASGMGVVAGINRINKLTKIICSFCRLLTEKIFLRNKRSGGKHLLQNTDYSGGIARIAATAVFALGALAATTMLSASNANAQTPSITMSKPDDATLRLRYANIPSAAFIETRLDLPSGTTATIVDRRNLSTPNYTLMLSIESLINTIQNGNQIFITVDRTALDRTVGTDSDGSGIIDIAIATRYVASETFDIAHGRTRAVSGTFTSLVGVDITAISGSPQEFSVSGSDPTAVLTATSGTDVAANGDPTTFTIVMRGIDSNDLSGPVRLQIDLDDAGGTADIGEAFPTFTANRIPQIIAEDFTLGYDVAPADVIAGLSGTATQTKRVIIALRTTYFDSPAATKTITFTLKAKPTADVGDTIIPRLASVRFGTTDVVASTDIDNNGNSGVAGADTVFTIVPAAPDTVTVTSAETAVTEGDAAFNITVALDEPVVSGTVTLPYTFSGAGITTGDFSYTVAGTATTGLTGNLVFAATEQSKIIAVTVLDDTTVEAGGETLNFKLDTAGSPHDGVAIDGNDEVDITISGPPPTINLVGVGRGVPIGGDIELEFEVRDYAYDLPDGGFVYFTTSVPFVGNFNLETDPAPDVNGMGVQQLNSGDGKWTVSVPGTDFDADPAGSGIFLMDGGVNAFRVGVAGSLLETTAAAGGGTEALGAEDITLILSATDTAAPGDVFQYRFEAVDAGGASGISATGVRAQIGGSIGADDFANADLLVNGQTGVVSNIYTAIAPTPSVTLTATSGTEVVLDGVAGTEFTVVLSGIDNSVNSSEPIRLRMDLDDGGGTADIGAAFPTFVAANDPQITAEDFTLAYDVDVGASGVNTARSASNPSDKTVTIGLNKAYFDTLATTRTITFTLRARSATATAGQTIIPRITSVTDGTLTVAAGDIDNNGNSYIANADTVFTIAAAGTVTTPDYSGITQAPLVFTTGAAILTTTLPAPGGGVPPFADYALTPALPAGLSFNVSSREITGTPTAALVETEFTLRATDANGATDELTFNITVNPNRAAMLAGLTLTPENGGSAAVGDIDVNAITVSVPFGTTRATVRATASDDAASFGNFVNNAPGGGLHEDIGGTTYENAGTSDGIPTTAIAVISNIQNGNSFRFTVTPRTGPAVRYIATITVNPAPAAMLAATNGLTLTPSDGGSAAIGVITGSDIAVSVPFGTTTATAVATALDGNASFGSIVNDGGVNVGATTTTNNGEDGIPATATAEITAMGGGAFSTGDSFRFTVTPQTGATGAAARYTVTITVRPRSASTDATLAATNGLTLTPTAPSAGSAEAGVITNNAIAVSVPFGTTTATAVATANDFAASFGTIVNDSEVVVGTTTRTNNGEDGVRATATAEITAMGGGAFSTGDSFRFSVTPGTGAAVRYTVTITVAAPVGTATFTRGNGTIVADGGTSTFSVALTDIPATADLSGADTAVAAVGIQLSFGGSTTDAATGSPLGDLDVGLSSTLANGSLINATRGANGVVTYYLDYSDFGSNGNNTLTTTLTTKTSANAGDVVVVNVAGIVLYDAANRNAFIGNNANILTPTPSIVVPTVSEADRTFTVGPAVEEDRTSADLGSLTVGGTSVPDFDAANTFAYGVTLDSTTSATILATPAPNAPNATIVISAVALDEGTETFTTCTTTAGANSCTFTGIDAGETILATVVIRSADGGTSATYTIAIGPVYARIIGGDTTINQGDTDADAFTIRIRNYSTLPDDGFASIRIDTDIPEFGRISASPLENWPISGTFNPTNTYLQALETADFNMTIVDNTNTADSRLTRSAFNREGSGSGANDRQNFRITMPKTLLAAGVGSNTNVNSEDVVVSLMAKANATVRSTSFGFGASNNSNAFIAARNSSYGNSSGNELPRDNSTGTVTVTVPVPPNPVFASTQGDLHYAAGSGAITDVVLPEATGGTGTIRYALTPDLATALQNTGLSYNAGTRTISGTPAVTTAFNREFIYRATDSTSGTALFREVTFRIVITPAVTVELAATDTELTAGSTDSQTFTLTMTNIPEQVTYNSVLTDVTKAFLVMRLTDHLGADFPTGAFTNVASNGGGETDGWTMAPPTITVPVNGVDLSNVDNHTFFRNRFLFDTSGNGDGDFILPEVTYTFTLTSKPASTADSDVTINFANIGFLNDSNAELGQITGGARTGAPVTFDFVPAVAPPASVTVTSAETAVNEGAAAFNITVALDAAVPAGATVTLPYTFSGAGIATTDFSYTVDGTDTTGLTGSLVFAATEQSKIIAVSVLDDSTVEADETLNFKLDTASSPYDGVAIDGNDEVDITISDPAAPTAVLTATSGTNVALDGVAGTEFTIVMSDIDRSDLFAPVRLVIDLDDAGGTADIGAAFPTFVAARDPQIAAEDFTLAYDVAVADDGVIAGQSGFDVTEKTVTIALNVAYFDSPAATKTITFTLKAVTANATAGQTIIPRIESVRSSGIRVVASTDIDNNGNSGVDGADTVFTTFVPPSVTLSSENSGATLRLTYANINIPGASFIQTRIDLPSGTTATRVDHRNVSTPNYTLALSDDEGNNITRLNNSIVNNQIFIFVDRGGLDETVGTNSDGSGIIDVAIATRDVMSETFEIAHGRTHALNGGFEQVGTDFTAINGSPQEFSVVSASTPPTTVTVTSAETAVTEGDAAFNITVALDVAVPTGATVTLPYTFSGTGITTGDFSYTVAGTATTGLTGSLVFAATERSKIIAVSVLDDSTADAGETLNFKLDTASSPYDGVAIDGTDEVDITISDPVASPGAMLAATNGLTLTPSDGGSAAIGVIGTVDTSTDPDSAAIAVSVPFGTTRATVRATALDGNASFGSIVNNSGVNVGTTTRTNNGADGTPAIATAEISNITSGDSFRFTVTPQTGAAVRYTVTITVRERSPNTDATLAATNGLTLTPSDSVDAPVVVDATNSTIAVSVPFGTETVTAAATANDFAASFGTIVNDSGVSVGATTRTNNGEDGARATATAEISNITDGDSFRFSVTPGTGADVLYTVTITVNPAPAATFTRGNGTFAAGGGTSDFSVALTDIPAIADLSGTATDVAAVSIQLSFAGSTNPATNGSPLDDLDVFVATTLASGSVILTHHPDGELTYFLDYSDFDSNGNNTLTTILTTRPHADEGDLVVVNVVDIVLYDSADTSALEAAARGVSGAANILTPTPSIVVPTVAEADRTFTVGPPAEDDRTSADLGSLTVGGTSVPDFDAANTFAYGVTLDSTTSATILATPALNAPNATIVISAVALDEGTETFTTCTTSAGANSCTFTGIDAGETILATVVIRSADGGTSATYTIAIGPVYARIIGGDTTINQGDTDADAFTIRIRNYSTLPDDGFASIRIDTDIPEFGRISAAPLENWPISGTFNPTTTYLQTLETADFNMTIVDNTGTADSRLTRSAFDREGSGSGANDRQNFRITMPKTLLAAGVGSNTNVNSEDVVVSLMAKANATVRSTSFGFGASNNSNAFIAARNSSYGNSSGNELPRGNTSGSAVTVTVPVPPGPVFASTQGGLYYAAGSGAITDVVLPEATGGTGAISYALTPDPSATLAGTGLSYDASTRTISGTPARTTTFNEEFTYTATDSTTPTALTRSVTFSIIIVPAPTVTLAKTGDTSDITAGSTDSRTFTVTLSNIPEQMIDSVDDLNDGTRGFGTLKPVREVLLQLNLNGTYTDLRDISGSTGGVETDEWSIPAPSLGSGTVEVSQTGATRISNRIAFDISSVDLTDTDFFLPDVTYTFTLSSKAASDEDDNLTVGLRASAWLDDSQDRILNLPSASTFAGSPQVFNFVPGPVFASTQGDLHYAVGSGAIANVVLPEATGGTGTISYALTPDPTAALQNTGLSYDAGTRTISGTPAVTTTFNQEFTYTATDSTSGTALFREVMFSIVITPAPTATLAKTGDTSDITAGSTDSRTFTVTLSNIPEQLIDDVDDLNDGTRGFNTLKDVRQVFLVLDLGEVHTDLTDISGSTGGVETDSWRIPAPVVTAGGGSVAQANRNFRNTRIMVNRFRLAPAVEDADFTLPDVTYTFTLTSKTASTVSDDLTIGFQRVELRSSSVDVSTRLSAGNFTGSPQVFDFVPAVAAVPTITGNAVTYTGPERNGGDIRLLLNYNNHIASRVTSDPAVTHFVYVSSTGISGANGSLPSNCGDVDIAANTAIPIALLTGSCPNDPAGFSALGAPGATITFRLRNSVGDSADAVMTFAASPAAASRATFAAWTGQTTGTVIAATGTPLAIPVTEGASVHARLTLDAALGAGEDVTANPDNPEAAALANADPDATIADDLDTSQSGVYSIVSGEDADFNTVTPSTDSIVEGPEYFQINLGTITYSHGDLNSNLTPTDGILTFRIEDATETDATVTLASTVTEGATDVEVTITLDTGITLATDAIFTLRREDASSGTQAQDEDVSFPNTITITAGQSSGSANITITDSDNVDAGESFKVGIASADYNGRDYGTSVTFGSSADVAITDADAVALNDASLDTLTFTQPITTGVAVTAIDVDSSGANRSGFLYLPSSITTGGGLEITSTDPAATFRNLGGNGISHGSESLSAGRATSTVSGIGSNTDSITFTITSGTDTANYTINIRRATYEYSAVTNATLTIDDSSDTGSLTFQIRDFRFPAASTGDDDLLVVSLGASSISGTANDFNGQNTVTADDGAQSLDSNLATISLNDSNPVKPYLLPVGSNLFLLAVPKALLLAGAGTPTNIGEEDITITVAAGGNNSQAGTYVLGFGSGNNAGIYSDTDGGTIIPGDLQGVRFAANAAGFAPDRDHTEEFTFEINDDATLASLSLGTPAPSTALDPAFATDPDGPYTAAYASGTTGFTVSAGATDSDAVIWSITATGPGTITGTLESGGTSQTTDAALTGLVDGEYTITVTVRPQSGSADDVEYEITVLIGAAVPGASLARTTSPALERNNVPGLATLSLSDVATTDGDATVSFVLTGSTATRTDDYTLSVAVDGTDRPITYDNTDNVLGSVVFPHEFTILAAALASGAIDAVFTVTPVADGTVDTESVAITVTGVNFATVATTDITADAGPVTIAITDYGTLPQVAVSAGTESGSDDELTEADTGDDLGTFAIALTEAPEGLATFTYTLAVTGTASAFADLGSPAFGGDASGTPAASGTFAMTVADGASTASGTLTFTAIADTTANTDDATVTLTITGVTFADTGDGTNISDAANDTAAITIFDDIAGDAGFTSVTVSDATAGAGFALVTVTEVDATTLTAAVTEATTNLSITTSVAADATYNIVATSGGASVSNGGGNPTSVTDLSLGDNVFTITVTSRNGRATMVVTLTVTRTVADDNNDLLTLTVGSFPLSTGEGGDADFDPDTTAYGVTLVDSDSGTAGPTTATVVATPANSAADIDIVITAIEGTVSNPTCATATGANTCEITGIGTGETALATITVDPVDAGTPEKVYTVAIGPFYARIIGGGTINQGDTDADAFTVQLRNYARVPAGGFANIRIDTTGNDFNIDADVTTLTAANLSHEDFRPGTTFLQEVTTADFVMSIEGNTDTVASSSTTRPAFNSEGSAASELSGVPRKENFRILVPQALMEAGRGNTGSRTINSEDVVVSLMAKSGAATGGTTFQFGATGGNRFINASMSSYGNFGTATGGTTAALSPKNNASGAVTVTVAEADVTGALASVSLGAASVDDLATSGNTGSGSVEVETAADVTLTAVTAVAGDTVTSVGIDVTGSTGGTPGAAAVGGTSPTFTSALSGLVLDGTYNITITVTPSSGTARVYTIALIVRGDSTLSALSLTPTIPASGVVTVTIPADLTEDIPLPIKTTAVNITATANDANGVITSITGGDSATDYTGGTTRTVTNHLLTGIYDGGDIVIVVTNQGTTTYTFTPVIAASAELTVLSTLTVGQAGTLDVSLLNFDGRTSPVEPVDRVRVTLDFNTGGTFTRQANVRRFTSPQLDVTLPSLVSTFQDPIVVDNEKIRFLIRDDTLRRTGSRQFAITLTPKAPYSGGQTVNFDGAFVVTTTADNGATSVPTPNPRSVAFTVEAVADPTDSSLRTATVDGDTVTFSGPPLVGSVTIDNAATTEIIATANNPAANVTVCTVTNTGTGVGASLGTGTGTFTVAAASVPDAVNTFRILVAADNDATALGCDATNTEVADTAGGNNETGHTITVNVRPAVTPPSVTLVGTGGNIEAGGGTASFTLQVRDYVADIGSDDQFFAIGISGNAQIDAGDSITVGSPQNGLSTVATSNGHFTFGLGAGQTVGSGRGGSGDGVFLLDAAGGTDPSFYVAVHQSLFVAGASSVSTDNDDAAGEEDIVFTVTTGPNASGNTMAFGNLNTTDKAYSTIDNNGRFSGTAVFGGDVAVDTFATVILTGTANTNSDLASASVGGAAVSGFGGSDTNGAISVANTASVAMEFVAARTTSTFIVCDDATPPAAVSGSGTGTYTVASAGVSEGENDFTAYVSAESVTAPTTCALAATAAANNTTTAYSLTISVRASTVTRPSEVEVADANEAASVAGYPSETIIEGGTSSFSVALDAPVAAGETVSLPYTLAGPTFGVGNDYTYTIDTPTAGTSLANFTCDTADACNTSASSTVSTGAVATTAINLEFAAGEQYKVIQVTALTDSVVESTGETLQFRVDGSGTISAGGGTDAIAVQSAEDGADITINDRVVGLVVNSLTNATVSESEGTQANVPTYNITLTLPAQPTGLINVLYQSDGTATVGNGLGQEDFAAIAGSPASNDHADIDFDNNGSVDANTGLFQLETGDFTDGVVTFDIFVFPTGDSADEGASETVILNLRPVDSSGAFIPGIGVVTPATATITDDDDPPAKPTVVSSFAASPTSITENSGTSTLTLRLNVPIPAGDPALGFDYTITGIDAGDITGSLTGTITVAAESNSMTLDITAMQDPYVEGDETMTITLDTPLPSNADGTPLTFSGSAPRITIEDDDVAVSGFCGRSARARDAILTAVGGGRVCDTVTSSDLTGVTTTPINVTGISATPATNQLKSGDFAGLSGATTLTLAGNQGAELPNGVFTGLDALTTLTMTGLTYTRLANGIFDEVADTLTTLNVTTSTIAFPATPASSNVTVGSTGQTITLRLLEDSEVIPTGVRVPVTISPSALAERITLSGNGVDSNAVNNATDSDAATYGFTLNAGQTSITFTATASAATSSDISTPVILTLGTTLTFPGFAGTSTVANSLATASATPTHGLNLTLPSVSVSLAPSAISIGEKAREESRISLNLGGLHAAHGVITVNFNINAPTSTADLIPALATGGDGSLEVPYTPVDSTNDYLSGDYSLSVVHSSAETPVRNSASTDGVTGGAALSPVAGNNTFTLPAGTSSAVFIFKAGDDDRKEGSETATLDITSVMLATDSSITPNVSSAEATIEITEVAGESVMRETTTISQAVGKEQVGMITRLIRQRISGMLSAPPVTPQINTQTLTQAQALDENGLQLSLAENPQTIQDFFSQMALEKFGSMDQGGNYAVWVRGQYASVSGTPSVAGTESFEYDGTIAGVGAGIERQYSNYLVGLALNYSTADIDSKSDLREQANYKETMNIIAPYAAWRPQNLNLTLWGTAGYGIGSAEISSSDHTTGSPSVSMFFAHGGVNHTVSFGENSSIVLGVSALSASKSVDAYTVDIGPVPVLKTDIFQAQADATVYMPVTFGGSVVRPYFGIATVHDIGDVQNDDRHAMEGRVGVSVHGGPWNLNLEGFNQFLREDEKAWGVFGKISWAGTRNFDGLFMGMTGGHGTAASMSDTAAAADSVSEVNTVLSDADSEAAEWIFQTNTEYRFAAPLVHRDGRATPFFRTTHSADARVFESGMRLDITNNVGLTMDTKRHLPTDDAPYSEHAVGLVARWEF